LTRVECDYDHYSGFYFAVYGRNTQDAHSCDAHRSGQWPITTSTNGRNVFKVASCKDSLSIALFGAGYCCCGRVCCPPAYSRTRQLASPSTDSCTSGIPIHRESWCCISHRLLTWSFYKAVACISWNATLLYTLRRDKAWINGALRLHIAIEVLLWMVGLTAIATQMASVTIRKQQDFGAITSSEDLALTATLFPLV
jgi:hypothetical protein